nr:type VI secretion system tip protein VgrG [Deltaproteobacteria bacterium]
MLRLGVITSVEDRGTDRDSRVYEIGFGPSLAVLAHRGRNRVWQNVDALQIVREVLDDAGLYAGDALVQPAQVAGDAPAPREYCVQFGESDLDFVRRLLAEEGVLFTFGTDGDDTCMLFDARAGSKRPLVPATDGPLPIHGHGDSTADAEGIRRIDAVTAMTVTAVSLRDSDFTHPREPLASAEARQARSVEHYPGRFVLGAYDNGGHAYGAPDARRTARISLQQHTAPGERLSGEASVTGMAAGLRFAVAESGERGLSGEFLLTAVLHLGNAAEESLSGSACAAGDDRYRNLFECVPAARSVGGSHPRPRADQSQVALVTAEPGSDEEICTDHYGRVLVRFPWDRPERRRAPQDSKRSSCWLRVMQPWAGAHWGFHFTPRVGMEVVVHFIDGDPDRPFVAGCLPNAANVPPVEVPSQRTQSTIRTRSSPKSDGFNELRFEDLKDAEEVYLHAQRDQRIEVLHDRSLTVGRDASAQVDRDESLSVGRDRSIDVAGDEQHSVEGNLQWSPSAATSRTRSPATTLCWCTSPRRSASTRRPRSPSTTASPSSWAAARAPPWRSPRRRSRCGPPRSTSSPSATRPSRS